MCYGLIEYVLSRIRRCIEVNLSAPTRELKESFDEYPISVRRDLERNFHRRERGNRTNFPVLGNFSPSKISDAFRVLSKSKID